MGLFKSIKKVTTEFSGSSENEQELIEEKTEILDAKQLRKERNKKIDKTVDEVADIINGVSKLADDKLDIQLPRVGFLSKTATKVGIKTAIRGGEILAPAASSAAKFVGDKVLTGKSKELASKGGKMAAAAASSASDFMDKKVLTDKNKAMVDKGLKGLKSYLSEED